MPVGLHVGYPQARWVLKTNSGWSVQCRCVCVCSGSSPHPSTPDEDDSQAELLIAEEKLSPEDEGQIMPR